MQDVAGNSSSNAREHCQIDKASAIEGEFAVTDCANCPIVCEKCGLIEVTREQIQEKGYPPYPIIHIGKEVSLYREHTPGAPDRFHFTEDETGISLHIFDQTFSRNPS